MKCILYDENNLTLEDYNVLQFNSAYNPPIMECTPLDSMGSTYVNGLLEHTINCVVDPTTKKIELDPTTMKKIAMYNKSVEFIKINEQIKEKERTKKYLENELNKLSDMSICIKELLHEYIDNSEYKDFEKFLKDKFSDNYDYDWDD